MCRSRREWREEMARREQPRKERDRTADRMEQPVFVADEDIEPDPEPDVAVEREPVGAQR